MTEMKSVVRSLRVLEAVAQHQPVTVGELTKLFELPKSTVQRTLLTLAEAGWLRASRGDRTRWTIGARVLAIRPSALQGSNLLVAAREPMTRLRQVVNETIHLTVPDAPDSVVVVDRIDCDRPVRTFHEIGDMSPFHATATGRAILAHLRPSEVDEIIAAGMKRYSETTLTTAEELSADLDDVRRVGYAINRWQYRPEVCAIAAPVLAADGSPIAAVAVSMPEPRWDPDRIPEWGAEVRAAAADIASRYSG